jgi:adenylate cyclase
VFEQLRQRNVHRVALAYLAGVWLLIQIVDTLTPDILPAGVFRVTVIAAAIGFIPAVVLAWIFEWTPEGLKRERAAPAGAPPPDSRWLDRGIIVTLVVAVAYFAIDKFLLDPVRDEEEIEAATAVAVDEALAGRLLEKYADRSVIVLPFLNLSTDPGQEFFADGIAEELLNLLAKIDELRVTLDVVDVQGQEHRRRRDPGQARCLAHPRRVGAQGRGPGSRHCAAHRRAHEPPPLVGEL